MKNITENIFFSSETKSKYKFPIAIIIAGLGDSNNF